ncbi:hypothetical protein [Oceanobacillus salinisoli]|uniref:hypothetical protein n=1 Tax=Oceanobacillus salinisoli TaxID=2678611 RepID=UPI0012E11309|nr:hypothetical protein [Oceanobacillus salinisoli]
MARQLKGLMYFFITDVRYSLMIFWGILLSILVLSLCISYFLLGVDDGKYYFTLTLPIYIYCAILGFLTVKEAIPFSVKLGATRKSVFIGIGLFFLGLSFAKAVVASMLHSITLTFTQATGISTFHFLHLSELVGDSWFTRVLIDTTVMFFALVFMFVIGLIFYKSGLAGGGIVTGALVLIILVGVAKGWLIDFFVNIFTDLQLTFFWQMLGAGVILYSLSYLVIREITIVKVK